MTTEQRTKLHGDWSETAVFLGENRNTKRFKDVGPPPQKKSLHLWVRSSFLLPIRGFHYNESWICWEPSLGAFFETTTWGWHVVSTGWVVFGSFSQKINNYIHFFAGSTPFYLNCLVVIEPTLTFMRKDCRGIKVCKVCKSPSFVGNVKEIAPFSWPMYRVWNVVV